MTAIREVNTDYGQRDVEPGEIVAVFGTAATALAKTAGENRIALFYVNNPHCCASAPDVPQGFSSTLATALRDWRDADDARERERERAQADADRLAVARVAYAQRGSVAAVMRACRVGRRHARALVEMIRSAP